MDKPVNPADEEIGKNYKLSSEAVEDLVSDEAPEYSQEELNRYRSKRGFHIPEWLKVLFLKFWFTGAVCYFILWGLGMYVQGLDMMFVLAMVLGMITDLLLNNVLRFMEKIPGENNKWMLVSRKGMVGFGLNLLYGCVLVFCVYQVYVGINGVYAELTGAENTILLGVEPILFGLLCMAFDMLFIGMKRLFGKILRDAMESAKSR